VLGKLVRVEVSRAVPALIADAWSTAGSWAGEITAAKDVPEVARELVRGADGGTLVKVALVVTGCGAFVVAGAGSAAALVWAAGGVTLVEATLVPVAGGDSVGAGAGAGGCSGTDAEGAGATLVAAGEGLAVGAGSFLEQPIIANASAQPISQILFMARL
jgi:hypothetical protein